MGNRQGITKVLVSAGTLLVWAPVAMMLVTAGMRRSRSGGVNLDWLIPVELFPAVIVGGAFLLAGAWRARWRVRAVGWVLVMMLAALGGGGLVAVTTGLASGRAEPVGAPFVLLTLTLALYGVGLAVLGVAGVLLLVRLFGRAALSDQ